jgi:hypothetical protein
LQATIEGCKRGLGGWNYQPSMIYLIIVTDYYGTECIFGKMVWPFYTRRIREVGKKSEI